MNFIPKIEYKQNTVNGTTTIGSDVVVSADDLSILDIGMDISGIGIPAGATILAINVGNFQISANATVNGANVLAVKHVIEYQYPPKKDTFGTRIKNNGRIMKSRSGATQTTQHFVEDEPRIEFSHVNQEIKDKMETFMINWYWLGNEFSWFNDKDNPASEKTVESSPTQRDFRPQIITRKTATDFVWKYRWSYREFIQ